jgi:glutaredoxin-like YruB-family protein
MAKRDMTKNATATKTKTKKRKQRVILFTTPSCSFCNAAKQYFRKNGVRFREVDVSKDPTAARDMKRRSGQMGVPVIDINGKIVVGFDRPKIERLLSQ